MNALTISIIVWGCTIAAFVALMIYRGYLGQHETDQLFLSEITPSASHQENDDVIRRVYTIEPICRRVGGAAILMTLVVLGVWAGRLIIHAGVI